MSSCLLVLTLALAQAGQTAQPGASSPVADVRETLAAARKEIEAYRAGGGKNGSLDHPAVKWQDTLWAYRDRNPGTDAAALATAEAIQLLIRAELFESARAKIESVGADDRAWERLAPYLYYDASARKDYAYAAGKYAQVASATRVATVKSATLVALGRVQRRQGDSAAAVKSLESARTAAPDSPSGIEADRLLYDIAHLSIGLRAPDFSATTHDGRAISLDSLKGKAVAIVFWGST